MALNECTMESLTMIYCGVLFLSLSWSVVSATDEPAISDQLFDKLFTNYKSSLLPRCRNSHDVTVTIDVALRQILEMNEKEQVLSTNVWLRLQWNDCRLVWDPASYENLTSLVVSFDDIWVPDMSIYDSATEGEMFPAFDKFKPTIYSSGIVTYNVPAILNSVCIINVRYFPFDSQRCSLKFGSWSQSGNEINVVNKTGQGDLSSYIENSEWEVDEVPVQRHIMFYKCCPDPYPDVTYYLVITRRPEFYMLTMIFPCVLTSFVATLVFLLPVESGEKVSLGITVLLSLAVFLLMVSESLPPSSNNFPILGQYFAISMALVSFCLLQSVLVLNVAYRGTNGRRVPRWVQVLFLKYIGRLLCIRPVYSQETSGTQVDRSSQKYLDAIGPMNHAMQTNGVTKETQNGTKTKREESIPGSTAREDTVVHLLTKQLDCLRAVNEHISARKTEEDVNAEWKCLSDILDRLFLITYFLTSIATALAHLLQCVLDRNEHINN